jgi:hypothetical protein
MKRISFWLALITAVVAVSNSGCTQVRNENSSHYVIVPETVERVEILYIPERFLTRAALGPEAVERQYYYKLEVRQFSGSVERERLLPALQDASFSPSPESYDFRTAVLLFDKSDKRLLSLYFSRGGQNGMVDRQWVSTNDAVYRWAKSMMSGFAN